MKMEEYDEQAIYHQQLHQIHINVLVVIALKNVFFFNLQNKIFPFCFFIMSNFYSKKNKYVPINISTKKLPLIYASLTVDNRTEYIMRYIDIKRGIKQQYT